MSANSHLLCIFPNTLLLHISFASKTGCKLRHAFMKLGLDNGTHMYSSQYVKGDHDDCSLFQLFYPIYRTE